MDAKDDEEKLTRTEDLGDREWTCDRTSVVPLPFNESEDDSQEPAGRQQYTQDVNMVCKRHVAG